MNQSATLIPVSFRNATLFVVDHNGQPFVPMKPVVEGMGLGWSGQYERLKRDESRWGIRVIRIPTQGADQDAICLPLRKLPGWLMTIQPTRVKAEIRETIIAYQNECDDVLWQHWHQAKPTTTINTIPNFDDPIAAAEAWISERKARLQSEQRLELARHKIEFHDQVVYQEKLLDKAQLFSLLKTKTGQTFDDQTFLDFLRAIGAAKKPNAYNNIGRKRFVPRTDYIDYWFVAQIGENGMTEWYYRNLIVADLVAIIEQSRRQTNASVQQALTYCKTRHAN
jgi:hypothetical protein